MCNSMSIVSSILVIFIGWILFQSQLIGSKPVTTMIQQKYKTQVFDLIDNTNFSVKRLNAEDLTPSELDELVQFCSSVKTAKGCTEKAKRSIRCVNENSDYTIPLDCNANVSDSIVNTWFAKSKMSITP